MELGEVFLLRRFRFLHFQKCHLQKIIIDFFNKSENT